MALRRDRGSHQSAGRQALREGSDHILSGSGGAAACGAGARPLTLGTDAGTQHRTRVCAAGASGDPCMTGVTPAAVACPGLEPHGATWSAECTASGSMGSGFWAGVGGAGVLGSGGGCSGRRTGELPGWLDAPWAPWTGSHPTWPRGMLVLLWVPGTVRTEPRATGRPCSSSTAGPRLSTWARVEEQSGTVSPGVLETPCPSGRLSQSCLSLLVGGFRCGALSPPCAKGGRAHSRPGGLATRPWGWAQEGTCC